MSWRGSWGAEIEEAHYSGDEDLELVGSFREGLELERGAVGG